MRTRPPVALLLAGVVAVVLSGCAATSAADTTDDSLLQIVASTDVYGDIAEQIGGEYVEVTSIIDDPSQDPHSYEASARQQLALSKAAIVIENGGGYDDFIDTLLDGARNDDMELLNVAEISGYDPEPSEGEFNEHLWYDFPTMEKVADRLVDELTAADESHAEHYRANGEEFLDGLRALEGREAELKSRVGGTGVAITEPVPLYLLEASGLVNRTPDAFSEAIEEGTDVPAAVLRDTLALFADGTVHLLAYNEQTAGPETTRLMDAAENAGVAIVSVTETLPDGQDYLGWMDSNLDAIEEALA